MSRPRERRMGSTPDSNASNTVVITPDEGIGLDDQVEDGTQRVARQH